MATALWSSYKQWADAQEEPFLEWVDPTGNFTLSPIQTLPLTDFATAFAISVGYLAFVAVGTLVMKAGVPPIKLSALQFVYNPLQVVVCSYMCLEAGIQAYRNGYSAAPCNAFDYEKPVMSNVLYMFYLSKALDFCDTFFIIVGKKWQQLSFLHVYHHFTVFLFYFINVRTTFDGDVYASIVLNGFIHSIMYLYYFVSSHTRNIWWKKYLTALQMIQFVTMAAQGMLLATRSCPGMPAKVPLIYLVYVASLLALFANFFVRSYCAKARKPKADSKKLN